MSDSTDPRKQPGEDLLNIIFDHARQGTVEPLRMYFEAGYTPNIANARGDSLLIIATYHGHEELTILLLAQPAIEVDYQNRMGFTSLTGASFKGYCGIMQALIAAGANVNHQNASGQTALMFASLTGRLEAVKLLLSHGADKEAQDATGKRAIDLAEMQEAAEVVTVLGGGE
ncbi:MAG: hypothetical protein JWO94_168 [Verrucomicrobiaceae bacterium]|nr:hypothetical protein [Verrucomicrobiaceae bacterium]